MHDHDHDQVMNDDQTMALVAGRIMQHFDSVTPSMTCCKPVMDGKNFTSRS